MHYHPFFRSLLVCLAICWPLLLGGIKQKNIHPPIRNLNTNLCCRHALSRAEALGQRQVHRSYNRGGNQVQEIRELSGINQSINLNPNRQTTSS